MTFAIIDLIAMLYSTASPKPNFGGRHINIFFPIESLIVTLFS